jgi:AcrR family transcriptional regulator
LVTQICSDRYTKQVGPARRELRREELVDGAVAYLLDRGLVGLSLRPLAKALGTSDRMLLYYFSSRDEIVEEALNRIGARIQALFESVLPEIGVSPSQAVEAVIREMADPSTRSHLQLWVEIVALAARGDPACVQTTVSVTSHWSDTLQKMFAGQDDAAKSAAAVIGIVDGLVVLLLTDRDDLVHATRRYLSALLPKNTAKTRSRRGSEQIA